MNVDLPSVNNFIEDRSNLPSVNDFIEQTPSPLKESVEPELPSYKDFLEKKVEQQVIQEEVVQQPIQSNTDLSTVITLIEGVRNSIPEVKSYDKELYELMHLIEELRRDIPEFKSYDQEIKEIKESIPTVPEVKYYDQEIKEIKESIPTVPEVKYYDREIQELRDSIPTVPEVKYYDKDIEGLKESINEVKDRYIPDFRWIYKSFSQLDESQENIVSNLSEIKNKLEMEINDLIELIDVVKFETGVDSKSLDERVTSTENTLIETIKETKDKIYKELRDTSLKVWNLKKELQEDDSKLKKQLGEQYKKLGQSLDHILEGQEEKYSKVNVYLRGLKEEITNLPEVKYYDEQITEVSESVESVRNLVEVLENKLNKKIEGLKESILVVPSTEDNTDPLTPLDQNFATLDDLSSHYRLFLNRIQQQLSTLGGGGAVKIKDMDDVDSSALVNEKFLQYNSTTKKWQGADASGGSDLSQTQIFTGGIAEKFQTGTTLATDNTLALSDGNVIRRTSNESGNQTVNFTGVHSTLSSGQVVSFTVIITPNGSGVINVVQIDGQAITIKWSGGSVPSAGSSGKDVYTFSVFKTGTGVSDYEVYGAATNYA